MPHTDNPAPAPSPFARKLRNFLAQPAGIQLGFLPVFLLLGLAKALILVIPFRRLAPRLGTARGTEAWIPLLDPAQEARAARIGRLVRLTARHTPWNSNCFPQAVVARLLLGLYGIPYTLFFGLARDPHSRDLRAHAWVAAGRIAVCGGISFKQFTVVGVFVDPRLASP